MLYKQFSNETKNQILSQLKDYFQEERLEEIGDLAAENILDFISKEIGPYFYNQGVKDAKGVCEEKLINLEEDILSLERPTGSRK
ncbi:DUF2164 domain-containing protein [Bacillus tamaricis]|uniref:DUF2164 domain-containing protein n=2 Tax=Evansella tamaricis TaxID=2069301 RepID=A0ABS6JJP2_9BACI|nr:DUF2164 domain-containing protein [Evansella tamaricis]